MRFRLLPPATALAAALTCVLVLSGCLPTEDIITPPPSPSTAPIFASDEEALAAATEAYARYRSVLDEIFIGGGKDISKLETVATGEQLKTEKSSFVEVRNRGLRSTGGTTFTMEGLQQYDADSPNGQSIVIAYVCEDVTLVDVIDQSGGSVVSSDRPDTSLYEVTFDLDSRDSKLMVSNKELWSDSPC